jgi:hypothetical protein
MHVCCILCACTYVCLWRMYVCLSVYLCVYLSIYLIYSSAYLSYSIYHVSSMYQLVYVYIYMSINRTIHAVILSDLCFVCNSFDLPFLCPPTHTQITVDAIHIRLPEVCSRSWACIAQSLLKVQLMNLEYAWTWPLTETIQTSCNCRERFLIWAFVKFSYIK